MNLLYRYSKQYWTLFIVALLLAATNQIFSLLDPLIFRHVIDNYATRYHDYTQGQFIRGADYCCWRRWAWPSFRAWRRTFRTTSQRDRTATGAKMYSDGIRHSLDLPYQFLKTSAAVKHW